ncbi:hypothetical protein [uncultured Methanobrevibacter sp.]|uniref:hypothetical protein n=1 Tax=uncultured Methanobrevibacter sp. TaxID=253161 RepID=UPI0025FA287B|nr:hypothetical protein [uncultured Methanobrevibacter sp.]
MDKQNFEKKWGKHIVPFLHIRRCPNCQEGIFEPHIGLTKDDDVMKCNFCGYEKSWMEYESDLKKLER